MNKLLAATLCLMIVLTACGKPSATAAVAGIETEPVTKVKMELYAMSQCPYGVQAENELAKVKEKLGDALELNIEYIGVERDGQFISLHGQPEIDGDTYQLCVKKYYPKSVIKFIACQNEKPTDLKGSIKTCADKNSMDYEKINACIEGDEGKQLLSESFKKSEEANADASPTIIIDGAPYNGQRDELSIMRALCQKLDIEACADIPECENDFDCTAETDKEGFCEDAKCAYKQPTEFELLIINDKQCTNCDTTEVEEVFTKYFPGVKIRKIDVSEAQDIIEKNEIVAAPAFLFEKGITESKMWKNNEQLTKAFAEVDYGLKMLDEASGAKWIIDEKAREEQKKLMGITPGDNKPTVDFFVMSYCPYGNQAEEGLAPVYELLGDSVEWKPHYVIYSNYKSKDYCYDEEQKYCSMHGLVELNQGLRELCVMEEYGMADWFKFAIAMNKKADYKNADSKWEGAAKELNYDTGKIKTCFEQKAEEYLAADLELNKAFGVTGSPAVFIDGEKYEAARTPQAYATAICSMFDDAPEACNDLSGLAGGTAPATGGCGV